MDILKLDWTLAAPHRVRAARSPGQAWPQWVPAAAAAVALVGLLVAFQQVVQHQADQGQARQQATAAQSESVWRCHSLPGRRLRDACMNELNESTAALPLLVSNP